MKQKKYLYMLAPVLSFGGAMGLTLFGMFRVLTDKPLRKAYGTQFCIRYMLYVAPLLVVPLLLLEFFLRNRIAPQAFNVVLFITYYVSGVIAAKLLGNWMKKVEM